MKNQFLLPIFLFLLGFSACKNDKHQLAFTMQKGDVFVHESQMETTMSQVFFGREMDALTLLNLRTKYEVLDVQKNAITLSFEYQDVKLYMDMGFSKVMLESATDDSVSTLEGMNPMMKALLHVPVQVVMDRSGKVREMQGEEKLLEAMLATFSAAMEAELKNDIVEQFEPQFNEKSLIANIEQTMAFLPRKKVTIGDKWTRVLRLNALDNDAVVEVEATLLDVQEDVAVVEFEGHFSVDKSDNTEPNSLVKMDGVHRGVVHIDVRTGRPLLMEMTQEVETELNFAGTPLPQTIVTKGIVIEHE